MSATTAAPTLPGSWRRGLVTAVLAAPAAGLGGFAAVVLCALHVFGFGADAGPML